MKRTKEELKKVFENGDKPKQEDFWDLMDSYCHKDETVIKKYSNKEELLKTDEVLGKIYVKSIYKEFSYDNLFIANNPDYKEKYFEDFADLNIGRILDYSAYRVDETLEGDNNYYSQLLDLQSGVNFFISNSMAFYSFNISQNLAEQPTNAMAPAILKKVCLTIHLTYTKK